MSKMNLELKVSGIEPVAKLAGLLSENYESLPQPVKNGMLELFKDQRTVWDSNYFSSIGLRPQNVVVFIDGVETKKIMEIYPDENEYLTVGGGIQKYKTIEVVNGESGEKVNFSGNGEI